MQSLTIEQGGILTLDPSELLAIKTILSKKGMSWDCIDLQQNVIKFPQQYVGYLGLPNRKIIIKPKHNGITISHILRVYYFLYSAQYTDLDTPMYDVDAGNDINLIKMFIQELLDVIHRGVPVEYKEKTDDLDYVRGNLHVVPTSLNIIRKKREAFNCTYDDLTRDIAINKVLLAALKKIEIYSRDADVTYIVRQFGNVDIREVPEKVSFNRNTAYCKKAVSLAYMILNDLTLSSDGESAAGESLLINFDRVYEDFIKKVLMEYSMLGKFSYWSDSKKYAFCRNQEDFFERSYLPDLLYDYVESDGEQSARAILDMKNKTSQPFHNADVYQMSFYGQMLSCTKIILCYPSSESKPNIALQFDDEKFFLKKIYGAYMNLAGNSASDFKRNVKDFVFKVECLL